jgi:hypothetical protein
VTTRSASSKRPADADLDRVVSVFDRLMHRLMAGHAPELNAIDLTMSQTKAMYLVLAAGQLRMSELAGRLGVSSATAEAEATLERFRELNSRRMRGMLSHVAADDLDVIERALHVLDAALAADQATTDPQGESQS